MYDEQQAHTFNRQSHTMIDQTLPTGKEFEEPQGPVEAAAASQQGCKATQQRVGSSIEMNGQSWRSCATVLSQGFN
jgi:hypothetical protein